MSSSATGSTRADAGEGNVDAAAELERTVERLNQGIVVTYELRAEADEPVAVDLQQSLPPELTVADVGFRTDAAPAEWTVEGDDVRGSGTVPGEGSVEYVLGLKLPEAPDELPTFPEPELTDGDGGTVENGEAVDDETVTDPTEIDLKRTEGTDSSSADAESTGTEESTGPALVGNTDGALADSVRKVIGGSESDDSEGSVDQPSTHQGDTASTTDATATDGGPEAARTPDDPEQGPAPRQNPTGSDELEAAVAAVEPELGEEGEDSLGEGETPEEAPELDLSIPEVGDGAAGTDTEGADTEETADDARTAETSADAGVPGDESAQEPAPDTAAPTADIAGLADQLAAADEAQQRAVREALGLDDDDDGPSGTVTVRLEKLESRLSAFEAYEDALAAFIDETGTVEEIETTATEAAEAADELRTEVADLREEVTGLREDVDAAREAAAAAETERAALREDLNALREDVDEALGLRQQLLGALQNAGGAASGGAVPSDEAEQSAEAAE